MKLCITKLHIIKFVPHIMTNWQHIMEFLPHIFDNGHHACNKKWPPKIAMAFHTSERKQCVVWLSLPDGNLHLYVIFVQHERPCCIGIYKLEPKWLKKPIHLMNWLTKEFYAEKIKVKVYVNQQNSVS